MGQGGAYFRGGGCGGLGGVMGHSRYPDNLLYYVSGGGGEDNRDATCIT